MRSANVPSDIPDVALPILNEVGYFVPDRLQKGDFLPELILPAKLSGELKTLFSQASGKPSVLIFGSYT